MIYVVRYAGWQLHVAHAAQRASDGDTIVVPHRAAEAMVRRLLTATKPEALVFVEVLPGGCTTQPPARP